MTEFLTSLNLERAVALLKKGEIVAFPTETVYGLGASIFNEEAVRKVFLAKGRPGDNPLIAHIADRGDLAKIAIDLPSEAHLLMEAFFPGPLTLLLPSHSDVPLLVRAGLPTLAVRMPQHPLARELIRLTGTPLVGPSANLSGKPSPTSAQHVWRDLHGKIAAVLDGGICQVGIESTVLLLEKEPLILRPGFITKEQIESVLKRPVHLVSKQIKGESPLSPGMKYRHYAPNASLKLYFSQQELENDHSQFPSTKRLLLLHCTAHNLYHLLREADEQQYDEIFILCTPSMQNDPALMDRLTKAACLTK